MTSDSHAARRTGAILVGVVAVQTLGFAAAWWVALGLTPGGTLVDLLVDAVAAVAILGVVSLVGGALVIVGVTAGVADVIDETINDAVTRAGSTNTNPPPVVAPLKAAESTWPHRRPPRAREHRHPHHTAFEGHRYSLGERDAL